MQIDAAKVLGLVTRQVRHFDKDGKPASAVVLARAYDTSVEDLWEAVTSKERVPRWFLPLEGDLKLGGRYQLIGNAGGTITACTPPHHFAATWEFGGGTSWIDVTVADARDSVLEFDAVKRHKDALKNKAPGTVDLGAHRFHRGSLEPVRPRCGRRRLGSLPGRPGHVPGEWNADRSGGGGGLDGLAQRQGFRWRQWRAVARGACGRRRRGGRGQGERGAHHRLYRGEPPPDVAHPGTGG